MLGKTADSRTVQEIYKERLDRVYCIAKKNECVKTHTDNYGGMSRGLRSQQKEFPMAKTGGTTWATKK